MNFRDISERKQSEEKFRISERLAQATIDGLAEHLCILDEAGTIVAVNQAWRKFAEANPPVPPNYTVGINYLAVCDHAGGPDAVEAAPFAAGIRAVMAGEMEEFSLEYPCPSPTNERWFIGRVTRFSFADSQRLVISHHDITARKQMEQALQGSEEKYRALFETMAQGVIYQNVDGHVSAANPAAEKILGLTMDQLQEQLAQGMPWQVIQEDGTDFPLEEYPTAVALQTGVEVRNIVMGILDPTDNQYRWINVNAVPQFQPGETRPYQVFATFDDITARKRAEDSLRRLLASHQKQAATLHRYAERLQGLSDLKQGILTAESPADVGQTALNLLRQQIPCWGAGITLLDFEQNEFMIFVLNIDSENFIRPGMRFPFSAEWLAPLQTGQVNVIDDTLNLVNPSEFVRLLQTEGIRAYLSAPLIAHQTLIGALNLAAKKPNAFTHTEVEIVREVAATLAVALQQARLLEAEQEARQQLRSLTHQLVTAQEKERRRLSRELHDEAGQALTGLKISLELLQADLAADLTSFQDRLDRIINLTDTTMEQIRLLAQALRPPALDAVGLNPTLDSLCRNFAQTANLSVKYRGVNLPRLPEVVNITMYRVLQEALTNIARHAAAERVEVTLQDQDAVIYLTVVDDGQGFQPTTVPPDRLGIIGMQERVSLLGGQLVIESEPGHGTRLTVRIPYQREQL